MHKNSRLLMSAIGGYFELELRKGEHYHKEALRLNTARNSFEYILRARGYKKVYMPYYTCEVMFQPLKKLEIEYSLYHIDKSFEICNLPILKEGEALLYTNYFALKQKYVESLANIYGSQLIVDNAQAFYAHRLDGIDTFYSARKFFGVPDGAYLYTDCLLEEELEQDISLDRMTHLIKRIELGAEAGYDDFRRADDSLDNQPIRKMSKITEAILQSIDYEGVARKRRSNYLLLEKHLAVQNKLNLIMTADDVPMAYPYFVDSSSLRPNLIANRLYVPIYWESVAETCPPTALELDLVKMTIPLPIDQRISDITRVLTFIHNN